MAGCRATYAFSASVVMVPSDLVPLPVRRCLPAGGSVVIVASIRARLPVRGPEAARGHLPRDSLSM